MSSCISDSLFQNIKWITVQISCLSVGGNTFQSLVWVWTKRIVNNNNKKKKPKTLWEVFRKYRGKYNWNCPFLSHSEFYVIFYPACLKMALFCLQWENNSVDNLFRTITYLRSAIVGELLQSLCHHRSSWMLLRIHTHTMWHSWHSIVIRIAAKNIL